MEFKLIMIKTSKEALTKEIEDLLDQGLDNKRIAEVLNTRYDANKRNSLSAMSVAKLRQTLNIKKKRAQKVPLFEIVEEVREESKPESTGTPYKTMTDFAPVTSDQELSF